MIDDQSIVTNSPEIQPMPFNPLVETVPTIVDVSPPPEAPTPPPQPPEDQDSNVRQSFAAEYEQELQKTDLDKEGWKVEFSPYSGLSVISTQARSLFKEDIIKVPMQQLRRVPISELKAHIKSMLRPAKQASSFIDIIGVKVL